MSFPPIMVAGGVGQYVGTRWTGWQPVHHEEQTHTKTHLGANKGIKIPEVDLFLHLCFISYAPPHPPACFLSFVIVSQTRWSRHRFIRTMSFHLASVLTPAAWQVIFSGCFDTGRLWIKDTFQDKFSSSSSSSFFTVNFAHDAVHHVTIHEKVMWVRSFSPDLLPLAQTT